VKVGVVTFPDSNSDVDALNALAVAGVLALITAACVLVGIGFVRSAVPPLPKQAIETTKENVEWLKARLKSVRK